ncbi:MAG: protein LphB [Legionellales bacterium]
MKKGISWYYKLCAKNAVYDGVQYGVFILLLLYLFILQTQAIWPFTIDDMYIPLRYARHWATGGGLLWNLQAPPVEGYSNFSFVLLAYMALVLKLNPVVVLKVAGLIGLFVTCLFVFLITRFWFKRRESLLPCIGLLLYKGQIIWAVSGLETTVYQALICAAVYYSFKGMGYLHFPNARGRPNHRSFFLAGLLCAFAGMTRPEAPVLIIIFFILMCFDVDRRAIKQYVQGLAFFLTPMVFLFLPYFFWRWHYYGLLFPNPVYCKGISNDFFLKLDINYLKLIWPFALCALPACIWAKDKRHCFLWLPGVVYLILLAGADTVVAFDNRLFLTAFVLLLPLALKGISEVIQYVVHDERYYRLSLYFILVYVALLCIPWMTLAQYRHFSQNPVAGEQLRSKVIQWLNAHTVKSDSIVLADSGMIPYYSEDHFIDSYCLNNAIMAQYPRKQRYEQFCKQIMLEKPKVIILTALIEHGSIIYTPGDVCLKALLKKQNQYKLMAQFRTSNPDSAYRYELFANF